MLAHLVGA
jgi:hypothetical protein